MHRLRLVESQHRQERFRCDHRSHGGRRETFIVRVAEDAMAPRGRVCTPAPVCIGEGACLASTRPPRRHGHCGGPVRAMAAPSGGEDANQRPSVGL